MVKVIEKTGDIDIRCSSGVTAGEQVQIVVEGDDLVNLRLRVRGPKGDVVCERLVRSTPAQISFRASVTGRYSVEVAPLPASGASASRNLTWSDWEADSAGPERQPRSIRMEGPRGGAVLDVA